MASSPHPTSELRYRSFETLSRYTGRSVIIDTALCAIWLPQSDLDDYDIASPPPNFNTLWQTPA